MRIGKFFKHKKRDEASGDGAASGDGSQNTGSQNNAGGNEFDYDNLWVDDVEESNQQQAAANNNGAGTANNNGTVDSEAQFDQHFQSLNILNGLNTQEMMQSPEAFQTGIENLAKNLYKQALVTTNQLVKQGIDGATASMETHTQNSMKHQGIVAEMHKQLPFTKMPAFAPMANGVLNTILQKKGMTPEKAIKHVKGYFAKLNTEVGGGNSGNGNTGFNGQQSNNGSQSDYGNSDDMDWVSLLGGSPEE